MPVLFITPSLANQNLHDGPVHLPNKYVSFQLPGTEQSPTLPNPFPYDKKLPDDHWLDKSGLVMQSTTGLRQRTFSRLGNVFRVSNVLVMVQTPCGEN